MRPASTTSSAAPLAVLAIAALLAAALPHARAAPAPSLRTFAPPAPLRAGPAPETEGTGRRASLCGTNLDAVVDVLLEHNARALSEPLPAPHSTDVGEIAVLENDGTLFYINKGGDNVLDLASAARAFYRTHGDDYDALAFYLASGLSTWLGSPTALAAAFVVRNPTQGIGLETFDFGAGFGSPSRLQVMLSMNGLHRYVDNPDSATGPDQFTPLDLLGHELGHRWSSYVYVDSAGAPVPALLGRAYAHWNFFFDSDASIMEGCNWVRFPADSFRTDSVTTGYGALDLYLMGLASKAETDSFFVVNEPTGIVPPGTYVPYSVPAVGVGCRGRATWWTVDDVEAVHGPRVPDAASAPHDFRMAFVLVVARDSAASAADLAKLEAIRARFGPYFATATRARGTIDCTLDSRAGRVCFAHRPLPDLESPAASRPVGARAFIAQAGIPIALDPGSVRLFWRPAGGGAFSEVVMTAAGGDSFTATFPATGTTGTIEYYLYAASDSGGIDDFDPPAGAAAPHTFIVGPDLAPPLVTHVPVRAQGRARMPQSLLVRVTDNLGVDSVWVEYAVNGGPPLSAATTPAGRDSFKAALGAGLDSGHVVTYRFVARDRALAGNVAYSSAAPETLRVGRDWTLDFENGADGVIHAPFWYSYRSAWRMTQVSSSPGGGTSWLCGSDSTDYPVHLDANLYLPTLSDIVPGTMLRFDHRYGLEEASSTYAWDGARLEVSVANGPWQVLTPIGGYSHLYWTDSNPFQRNTPCWSGSSGGWRSEVADLAPYAPGPLRIRFRMLADEFLGDLGWFVDHVRITYPGATTDVEPIVPRLAVGSPWPNPARDRLRQSVALERHSAGEWTLYDLAGRRVATLWRGRIPAGGFELSAPVPGSLRSGLYFARLTLDGHAARTDRVAVIR